MTTKELKDALELTEFSAGEEKIVTTGYCCDLLSWVMGQVESDSAWVTVMNNENVAAVALLRDVACVILAEGVTPSERLLERAKLEQLPLYGSKSNAFILAVNINNAISI